MTFLGTISWPAFLLLGAGHGINPGMGWLFAVALWLQERQSRAVWRALPPLALGHALATGVVVAAAAAIGLVIPAAILRWLVAALLLGFGAWRLWRSRHPRFGGMRASARDLAIWSFLMATAHGAGLMLLPFLVGASADGGAEHDSHAAHAAVVAGEPLAGVYATVVHTIGYLVVTGVIALLVHRYFGLRLLRRAWINLDVIWAAALMATAVLMLVV